MRHQDSFRTNSDAVFVVEFWLPLILFVGMGLVLRHAQHAIALGLPITLWAVFNLTAAQVKPGDRTVQYRRLLRWKQIPC